jgi:hypothetical protein
MRIVNFTDKKGYLRSAWVKEEDPDSMAKYGIPVEIPDLEMLDWDGLKRDMHNALTQAEFYTLEDVMKAGNAFGPAVTVLKRYLTNFYMSESVTDKSSGG